MPDRSARLLALCLLLAPIIATAPVSAQDWAPIGMIRIRDLTPFGLPRLDLLPAHAVAATPGTWAVETAVSYQNTYVLSENVDGYLKSRGNGRDRLNQEDVAAILAQDGDSYFVDGEFGLADLTLHYRASEHWGLYTTIPYYFFNQGFLDSSIEGFHSSFGLDSAGRDLVNRNDFQVVASMGGDTSMVILSEPSAELGDPVTGVRYSLFSQPGKWNLIVEGAAKWSIGDESLVSSGKHDFGGQATLQRFFEKHALYLSGSVVYFRAPFPGVNESDYVPTVIAGWEFRITSGTNGILQFYASPSIVQDSTVEELMADKFQLTLGAQSRRGNTVWRFGITENLSNFQNTPDIGVSLGVAKILPGRR